MLVRLNHYWSNPENPPSCTDVQVATDDYVKFTEELDVCQGKIAETTAGSNLVKEVETTFEFLEKYNPVYVQALQFLEAKTTSLQPTADLSCQGNILLESNVSNVLSERLPKLGLLNLFTTIGLHDGNFRRHSSMNVTIK